LYIGKLDSALRTWKKNLETIINALKKAKPSSTKGIYFKKVYYFKHYGPWAAYRCSEYGWLTIFHAGLKNDAVHDVSLSSGEMH